MKKALKMPIKREVGGINMKKFLVLLSALTMAIGLAACSSNSASSEKKETKTASADTKKVDVKQVLVKFYMDLYNNINQKDEDLNTYEGLVDKKAEDSTVVITPDQKAKASDSAAAVAAYLNGLQSPADLKDQKAGVDAAIKDLAASYQAKADELKKDAPNLDAANAAFAKADDELGTVFVNMKLFKPSLAKQVN